VLERPYIAAGDPGGARYHQGGGDVIGGGGSARLLTADGVQPSVRREVEVESLRVSCLLQIYRHNGDRSAVLLVNVLNMQGWDGIKALY
jgi:hypothetical protein